MLTSKKLRELNKRQRKLQSAQKELNKSLGIAKKTNDHRLIDLFTRLYNENLHDIGKNDAAIAEELRRLKGQ